MITTRISPFLTHIRYLIEFISTDLIRCVIVTRILCTPLIIVIGNCCTNFPWICMPLFFNIMVSSSILCLDLGIHSILLIVRIFAWLRVGWLIVILTLFGTEWHCLVNQGILPSKGVLHTSPFSVVLHKFLYVCSCVVVTISYGITNVLWSFSKFWWFCAWI
jgi:hypothetical protein